MRRRNDNMRRRPRADPIFELDKSDPANVFIHIILFYVYIMYIILVDILSARDYASSEMLTFV